MSDPHDTTDDSTDDRTDLVIGADALDLGDLTADEIIRVSEAASEAVADVLTENYGITPAEVWSVTHASETPTKASDIDMDAAYPGAAVADPDDPMTVGDPLPASYYHAARQNGAHEHFVQFVQAYPGSPTRDHLEWVVDADITEQGGEQGGSFLNALWNHGAGRAWGPADTSNETRLESLFIAAAQAAAEWHDEDVETPASATAEDDR